MKSPNLTSKLSLFCFVLCSTRQYGQNKAHYVVCEFDNTATIKGDCKKLVMDAKVRCRVLIGFCNRVLFCRLVTGQAST